MRPYGVKQVLALSLGALAIVLVAAGPETIPARLASVLNPAEGNHPFLGLTQTAAARLAFWDDDPYGSVEIYPDEPSGGAEIYPDPPEYGGAEIYRDDEMEAELRSAADDPYGGAEIYPDPSWYPDVSYPDPLEYYYPDLATYDAADIYPDYVDPYVEVIEPDAFTIFAPETYYEYEYPVRDDSPWYVSAFPGIGRTISQILPPILRGSTAAVPASTPRPHCSISASPDAVAFGGSTTLYWTSENAVSGSLTGIGAVAPSGQRSESGLTISRQYVLTVTGPGGSSTCSAVVAVAAAAARPSCVLSANPSAVREGQSTSIAWFSENATSAYLSGVGAVPLSSGFTAVPERSTTYTLTVYGTGGVSNHCSTQVRVNE